MENTMKMYITAEEAAEILGVSRGYLIKFNLHIKTNRGTTH